MSVHHLSSLQSLADSSHALHAALTDPQLTSTEHCAGLKQQVAAYEQKYKISSAEVHQRIEEGLLEEDLDVCNWLIVLAMLDYECG